MKKILISMIILLMSFALLGCQNATSKQQAEVVNKEKSHGSSTESSHVINIKEKLYVSYINEIYTNAEDYIGKKIKLEGMFLSENYPPEDLDYHHFVYRQGPGCCGNDGAMCGFEISYQGELPKNNDWVEAVGTLRSYQFDGQEYLILELDQLTVLNIRGEEIVSQ